MKLITYQQPFITNVVFFYVLAVVVSSVIFSGCNQPQSTRDIEAEKEAIRNVVAMETEAYFKQDFELWRSAYVDTSYFRMYGYWEGYPEKVKYYNGFDELETLKKKQFDENETLWTGSKEFRENENFRITDDMAWYTFDQRSEDSTGKLLGKSVEVRILEKHNQQWKIAMMGYHYLPTDSLLKQ